ncbi:MAG: GNAT family N-acetyltransferase [Planctomycetota bacterium]|nr:GNAT family N-acetyltransferase [Planctomycetota bacterium]MDE2217218.1 GNAT family N-acetyltransferase [Planctomycetota bacterium]
MNIRHASEHDLDACYTIESACYTSDAATKEQIQKRIQLFPEGFLVAEFNGRVIGIINSASTNKEDITDEAFKDMVVHVKDGKNIVIFSLAVLPEFRRNGISKKLMMKFLDVSKALKKERILLICKSELIPYYQKYGFFYGGKSKSRHGGFEWYEMYLPLGVEEC